MAYLLRNRINLSSSISRLFADKELAVVANVGTLVQPTSRLQYQSQAARVRTSLFSYSDQQWQTSNPTSLGATGWADRAAGIVAAPNPSRFPTSFSVAGNSIMGNGRDNAPGLSQLRGSPDLIGSRLYLAARSDV